MAHNPHTSLVQQNLQLQRQLDKEKQQTQFAISHTKNAKIHLIEHIEHQRGKGKGIGTMNEGQKAFLKSMNLKDLTKYQHHLIDVQSKEKQRIAKQKTEIVDQSMKLIQTLQQDQKDDQKLLFNKLSQLIQQLASL